jgi:ubiquinone/menaquinone biosynthesis C-methylase UbiE
VVGVDNEPLGIEFAKKNIASIDKNLKCEFVFASAYELPFPDNSFDYVISCEVIEHLESPERMVAEAYRVLKQGGKFILTTPHRLTETPKDPNHFREYFPSELSQILHNKFNKVKIKLTHHILWFGLYSYSIRKFSNRQPGRWFINVFALWFGYNPFMIDYAEPTKFDRFTQMLAVSEK